VKNEKNEIPVCTVTTGLQKYEYITCDGRCSSDSNPNVKALINVNKYLFKGDRLCVLPGKTCTSSGPSCCEYGTLKEVGLKETANIPEAPITECINGQCVICRKTRAICTTIKRRSSIYPCCEVVRNADSKVRCKSSLLNAVYDVCTDNEVCQQSKEVLSCNIPGSPSDSTDLCQCPEIGNEPADAVGHRCNKDTKTCEDKCGFLNWPCTKDGDCCDQLGCGKKKKCDFCANDKHRKDGAKDSCQKIRCCNPKAKCKHARFEETNRYEYYCAV